MSAFDGIDHYAVLGVTESAATAEIRRCYLRLAREHHPDFHESTDASSRAKNEREMQRINQAWTVLGDPVRREAYDARRRGDDEASTSRFRPSPADYTFVPFDDDDTDYSALIDDAVEGTGIPRWMQLLPVLLMMGGVAVIILGVMVNLSFLLSLGVIGIVLGLLGFLASPVVAIARSRSHERQL